MGAGKLDLSGPIRLPRAPLRICRCAEDQYRRSARQGSRVSRWRVSLDRICSATDAWLVPTRAGTSAYLLRYRS